MKDNRVGIKKRMRRSAPRRIATRITARLPATQRHAFEERIRIGNAESNHILSRHIEFADLSNP
jgi:hypothetical protein